MEDKECADVRAFHKKFNMLTADKPTHLTKRKLAERCNFILEELRELADAAGLKLTYETYGTVTEETGLHFENNPVADQDLALQTDALIDLAYVVKGTAVMMGLPWTELWDDVHRANLAKVPGVGKRGNLMDVVKPEGWESPRTEEILSNAGYDRRDFVDDCDYVIDGGCSDDEVYR